MNFFVQLVHFLFSFQPLDVCNPNPCKHEGKCIDENGTESCQCMDGYDGQFCEHGKNFLFYDNVIQAKNE